MVVKAYLEPEDIEILENAAAYMRDKLLIRILFRLGCRISEALGISVDDIDFNAGTVTIEHLKARVRLSCPHCAARLSKMARFCPNCGSKVEKLVAEERSHRRLRTLPIDHETLAMIREYISHGGSVSHNGKKLLFGISRYRAWGIIKEIAQKAGLPAIKNPETGKIHNVSPHRLRDAFAIRAVKLDDSGDSLRMLQEHLGHKSISTTMRYRKISGEEHKEWYEKLWATC